MNTNEIDTILYADCYTRPFYGGTWALDKIPESKNKTACYVINTAPSWHPGTHWIAIFATPSKKEYFCSYGSSPQPELLPLLGSHYTSNTEIIQDLRSDLCGQYCILYLLSKCRGYSLKEFILSFSLYSALNDRIASGVYENYISNKSK